MSKKIVLYCLIFVFAVLACFGIIFAYNKVTYPLKFEEEIVEYSAAFGVDPALVASIINAESGFREDVVSKKGAVGLMQIMPKTGKWALERLSGQSVEIEFLSNEKDGILFLPEENIKIGTYYLSYLIEKFKDLNLVICAYNAGEGTVSSWLSNSNYSKDKKTLETVPYKETANYLEKVLRNLKVYQKKF